MPPFNIPEKYATIQYTRKICHHSIYQKNMPLFNIPEKYATIQYTRKICHYSIYQKNMPLFNIPEKYTTIQEDITLKSELDNLYSSFKNGEINIEDVDANNTLSSCV